VTTGLPKHPIWGSWILWLGLGLAFWLLVGLLEASLKSLFGLLRGQSAHWASTLDKSISFWILPGLFTPLVVWISRRVRPRGGWPWRSILILFIAGLVFATVISLCYRQYLYLLMPGRYHLPELIELMPKYLASDLIRGMLAYLVSVVAIFAGDYYHSFREKEQAAAALELEHARLEASLSEATLAALRMQLQPHFLFNSLHAISTLILRGDGQAANQMLLHLSNFLRMTLDDNIAAVVPLAVELEYLDAYLRIQRERFQERLQVTMDLEPEALTAGVPHLVLQPLVENAIRHGIDSETGAVAITVTARRAGTDLTLQVQDSGPGLPANGISNEGVGLSNIRARLAQLYPDAHEFTLHDVPSGGLAATIRLPFRPQDEPSRDEE